MIDTETKVAVLLEAAPEGVQEPTSDVPPAVTVSMPEQEKEPVNAADALKTALANPTPEIRAMLDEFVAKEVKAALAGVTPQRDKTDPKAIQKAQFDKMPYKERVKLFMEYPTVYKKLVGGNA